MFVKRDTSRKGSTTFGRLLVKSDNNSNHPPASSSLVFLSNQQLRVSSIDETVVPIKTNNSKTATRDESSSSAEWSTYARNMSKVTSLILEGDQLDEHVAQVNSADDELFHHTPRRRASQSIHIASSEFSQSTDLTSNPGNDDDSTTNTSSVDLMKRLSRHNTLNLKWMKTPVYKPVEFYASPNRDKLYGQIFLSVPSMKLFRKWKRVFFVADCFVLRLYSSFEDAENEANSLFELILDVDLKFSKIRRPSTTLLGKFVGANAAVAEDDVQPAKKQDNTLHYFQTYYQDVDRRRNKSRGSTRSMASLLGGKKSSVVSLNEQSENGYCKLGFETKIEAETFQSILTQATMFTINPELDKNMTNVAKK